MVVVEGGKRDGDDIYLVLSVRVADQAVCMSHAEDLFDDDF